MATFPDRAESAAQIATATAIPTPTSAEVPQNA